MKMKLSKNRGIDFRVSTCPTLFGEKIVLRILDPAQAQLGIESLGYEPFQKELYLKYLAKPQGMILVTGPTGSGKTVSLYTGLAILNREDTNISTAEDPAEINLPGVNQVNVNPKVGLTFAAAMRAFLRQDPDVIMVGEIRDLETAEIAIKAAQTGHLVLSTLHTNDAPQTLTRMVDMGVKPYAIATSVSLIIAQRLARRLCSHCKQPLEIPREALLKEGFTQADLAAGMRSLAPDEQALRAELRRQGVAPSRIRRQRQVGTGGKPTPGDIAVFSRQLATMLAAGIPLVQSFEIVGNGHEKPAMQKLILDVKADVEGGTSLHEALGKHPLYFDDLYVNLVEAGEHAGALESLLDKVATYKEKSEALKKKVKKALFYPAAVLAVAVIVTVVLLLFVIPQFESLYKGFGADLPAFTQAVINLSRFVQHDGIYIAIVLGLAGYVFFYFKKRSKAMRELLDRLSLKIPVIGPILNKAAIARYARTLSTMFAAGVPLVEALDSVAGATGNIVYENAVIKMRDEVSTGQRLQRAMENTGLFPNMVNQMIAVGEESGSLDDMSGKVATFYEAEVDNAVDAMSSLLEPLIMVILGVLVGSLVIAMYLPIFKLGSVV